jgi:hypothetical protein
MIYLHLNTKIVTIMGKTLNFNICSKIPFGSGSSRFGDDFPQINSMPGPGSYNFDVKSYKSSPSRAPKFDQTHQIRHYNRFESPRNSEMSHTNTVPEVRERIVMPRKSPMKSSLSVIKNKLIQRPNINEGKSNSREHFLSKFVIELDVSPSKYNPNFNSIKKKMPSVSLGHHTTKNSGSMKNYMENFIRTILPSSEANDKGYQVNLFFTISLQALNEVKPSMAGRIAKQSNIKSTGFAIIFDRSYFCINNNKAKERISDSWTRFLY